MLQLGVWNFARNVFFMACALPAIRFLDGKSCLVIGTSSFGASAHYTHRFSSVSHGRIAGRFGRYLLEDYMDKRSLELILWDEFHMLSLFFGVV